MARRLGIAAAVMLLVFGMPAAAPAQADGSWLEGGWRGEGRFQGRESRATLDVAPALGGRFLELDYGFEATASDGGTMRFEGRGFYRRDGTEGWTGGTWLDSGGAIHALRGTMGDGELRTLWGERGRTTYRLDSEGRLEIADSVRGQDGTWSDFARHTLVRRPDDD